MSNDVMFRPGGGEVGCAQAAQAECRRSCRSRDTKIIEGRAYIWSGSVALPPLA